MGKVIKNNNSQQDAWSDNDLPVVDQSAQVNIDPTNFRDEIAAHESKGMGDYHAENDSSTAKGRYQFLWSQYGDQIRKTTGVKSVQDFLDSPEAQDKFMEHYTQNEVVPWVNKMRVAGQTRGLTDKQLGQLYHFVGQPGAEHYLQTGKYIVPGNNPSIGDYTTEKVPLNQSASNWNDEDLPIVENSQKKSPSDTISATSSQDGQTGASQNSQQPFVWNGATPEPKVQPVNVQDAIIKTAQAKQSQIAENARMMEGNTATEKSNNAAIAIHTDLLDAINGGQIKPSNNDVQATLNAASDPHGDPAYNGQIMQQRISALESQKKQELLNRNQAGADKIDIQLTQLRSAYDHIRGLQQANRRYLQSQIAAIPSATPQTAEEGNPSTQYFNEPIATVPEIGAPQGVDAGGGVSPEVQAGLDYQAQTNLQKVAATQPYDPTALGLEHQALGGNKDAQKDLAKYRNGIPLEPAKKVAYEANGLHILQSAAANASENNQHDAATQFNSASDNPEQRIENDNPQYFKDYHANLIANTRYKKDGNPLYSTIFSEPEISREQLQEYGKENGLTPEQIAKLKPSDIPTGANWFEEAGQGAINAIPFLNTLAPETKKLFIGNTPTDQQSGKGVKGVLSHMASSVGMVGSFMAQTALTGGLLEGTGVLGDVAENAPRYSAWASRIPLAASNFNSSYEHSKEIIGDDPKDEGKRLAYAIPMGIVSTALMSIDPYAKVGQEALGATKDGLAYLLKTKDLADITKQEYQSALERTTLKAMEGSKVTAQHVGTQAGIMGANQIAQNLTDKVFDPEHPHEVMDNVKDAAIGGAMALLLPSIGAGYAAAKASTPLNVATMWEMGNSPEKYKAYIDDHLTKGTMTAEDAQTSYQNLNKISEAVKATQNLDTPTGEELTPEQKARYAFSLFQEQKLNEKLQSLQAGEKTTNLPPDKAQIDPINTQIKEQQAERGDILTNSGKGNEQEKPLPAGIQTDADNKIKVNELIGRNILYKGEPATMSVDEGGEVTVTNKETGKTHILGQAAGIGEESARNYDVEEPKIKDGKSVVSTNGAGNITVRGKEYIIPEEHADNPVGAINYYNRPGEKGKPVSVTLDQQTPTGGIKKVTFRGDVGEDIMYQLHLKKLDKDNIREEANKKVEDNVAQSENNNIPLSGNNDNSNQSQQNLTENGKGNNAEEGRQDSPSESNQRQENADAESSTNSEGRNGQEENRVLNQAEPVDNKAGATTPALSVSDKIAALKKTKLKAVKKEQQAPPITEHPEYKAMNLGTENGKDAQERKQIINNTPNDQKIGGGESFNEFADRIKSAWENTKKTAKDQTAMIAHSGVMRMLDAAQEHGWDDRDALREAYNNNEEPEPGERRTYKTDNGEVHIIRHPESQDGKDGKLRRVDTPLTREGEQQAAEIAANLKKNDIAPPEIQVAPEPRTAKAGDIVQEEFAKPEETTFKTSKGSTYTLHSDGTTTRNKAERADAGHEGQHGIQPKSEKTYFVKKEDLNKLDLVQSSGWKEGEHPTIADLGDGKIAVGITGGERHGQYIGKTVVEYERQPKVGLYPLETMDNGTKHHFGNEITEVNKEQPKETTKSNGAIATEIHKKPESLIPKKEKNDSLQGKERQRSAIQRDQEIADNSNALADKWQAQYEKNKKNHAGEALGTITGLPKLSDKVQDFLVGHAIQAIRDLGNIRVAIRRAIRETKERWGKEAKDLSDEHIKALEDHFPEFNKRPKFEPKLPTDHEDFAKNIIDLMRSGDISHEEAQQIVHETDLFNRDDEDYSDHVAENNKADILNYIDWHNDHDLTNIKNATTRMRREQYGLDEEMPAIRKTFGDTLDEAKKSIADGLNPRDLVDELAKNPRPHTDVEAAILAIHGRKLDNDMSDIHSKIKNAAESDDKGALAEAITSRAAVEDEYQKLVNVTKSSGTETGRALNARKLTIDQKYTLVNMINEKRSSANDGQPLSEDQRAHIEELNQKIKDTQDAADAYMQQKQAEFDKKITELQDQLLKVQQEKARNAGASSAGKTGANQSNLEKTQSKSKAVAARMHKWADNFKEKNKGMTFGTFAPITPNVIADAVHFVANGIEKGADVIEWVQKAISKAKEDNPDINELTLKKHINQALIDSGAVELTPANKSKIKSIQYMTGFFKDGKYDKEAERLNVAANRAKDEFDTEIKKDQQKQLHWLAKAQNAFISFTRAAKLSSPITAAKIAIMGISRVASNAAEDIAGNAIGLVAPTLAKGAIGESGGINVAATARALRVGMTQGLQDAWQIMSKGSGGKSDLDVLYGKGGDLPPEVIEFFGKLHSAEKAPVKRAAFERAIERRITNTLNNGGDPTDPIVETAIFNGAYQDANRAIFMQDNKVASWWQNNIKKFQQVDPKTGESPDQWKATAMQFMIPFAKVPSNWVAETARYVGGFTVGVGQLIHAKLTGSLESMPADQKDVIMRNLKKGCVGLAAMSYGFFNPQNFGGYYQPGQKRKEDDADALGYKFFGHKLPAYIGENPAVQAMQFGSTVRRVMDHYMHGEKEGIVEGLGVASLGLIQNNPLIAQPLRFTSIFHSQREREAYLDELIKGTFIPSGVDYAAKVSDNADDRPLLERMLYPQNQRKTPKNLEQTMEGGIPGLRENLPLKHPKPVEEPSQFQ